MKKPAKSQHKKGRNVVDLPALKQYAVNAINQIDYWSKDNSNDYTTDSELLMFKRPKRSSHTPSVKNKYYQRTARHIKNALFDSKSKTKNTITLNTYHKYLSIIRSDIKREVGRVHPLLSDRINSLISNYPKYANIIQPILDHKAETIGYARSQALEDLLSMKRYDADELYSKLIRTPYKHPIIPLLSKTDAQSRRRAQSIADNLDARKSDVMRFNFHEIMKTIDHCFDSDDFNTLSVGLALATGRRAIEIVYQGEFKKKSKYDVLFSGQAKHGIGVEIPAYSVPTVIESDKIIDAFQKLRSTSEYAALEADFGGMHEKLRNAKINQRVSRMLNYRVKRLLDPTAKRNKNSTIDSPRQFKDTRAIAVKIALDKIHPTQKYSKEDANVFIKNYCGHDSYEESKNYQHVLIDYSQTKAKAQQGQKKETTVDISALEVMDSVIDATRDRAVIRMHDKVKAFALRSGVSITQAAIYKGKKVNGKLDKAGGSLVVVKRYIAVGGIKQAISEYNNGLS